MRSFLIVTLGVSALLLALVFLHDSERGTYTPEVQGSDQSALLRAVEELSERVDRLEGEVAELRTTTRLEPAPLRAPADRTRTAPETVRRAQNVVAAAEPSPVRSLVDELLAPHTSEEEIELWEAARRTVGLDDTIDTLEQRCGEVGDADTEALLGQAYIQKIQAGVPGDEAEQLAEMADSAFDRALTLDPFNWEARYNKAVALSYWPEGKGRQGDVVQNLEVLVQQQAGLTGDPRYARTHVYLGDAYEKQGDVSKAIAAWQQGLALYPDNAELRHKLESAREQ